MHIVHRIVPAGYGAVFPYGMEHIGVVSSEGGPFLLADARAVRAWGGIESGEYEKLCDDLVAAGPTWGIQVRVAECDAVAWEPEGACVVDVYITSPRSLLLVRVYTAEVGRVDAVRDAGARAPLGDAEDIGRVDVGNDLLAVLWAPESGGCILNKDLVEAKLRASGPIAIEESCMLVRLAEGRYRCFADNVDVEYGTVLRCQMEPDPAH